MSGKVVQSHPRRKGWSYFLLLFSLWLRLNERLVGVGVGARKSASRHTDNGVVGLPLPEWPNISGEVGVHVREIWMGPWLEW